MRKALREARKTKFPNLKEFADLIGVSDQAVLYWEAGQRTPNADMAARVATLLERPAAELWPDLAERVRVNAALFGVTSLSRTGS